MKNYSSTKAPIVKGDNSKARCPDEKEKIKVIPYSSLVGSLMYTQVCTRFDLAFVVIVLGKYLSDHGLSNWKVVKKVMRYLQDTKDKILTYQHTNVL